MKKSMLALVLPALLGAGSAHAAVIYQADDGSNVDLYGRLGFYISDKKSGNDQGDFDGRIGFTARQTVNDDFAVIGMAQYQVNAAEYVNNVQKNNSDLTARYVWAGSDGGQLGKVTGGRVSSGLIMFTDVGDVFAANPALLLSDGKGTSLPMALQALPRSQDGLDTGYQALLVSHTPTVSPTPTSAEKNLK